MGNSVDTLAASQMARRCLSAVHIGRITRCRRYVVPCRAHAWPTRPGQEQACRRPLIAECCSVNMKGDGSFHSPSGAAVWTGYRQTSQCEAGRTQRVISLRSSRCRSLEADSAPACSSWRRRLPYCCRNAKMSSADMCATSAASTGLRPCPAAKAHKLTRANRATEHGRMPEAGHDAFV